MWAPDTILIIITTFLLAGFIKGVTGLGLPTVSLAMLTALLGFQQALVLMLAPALITNIWQAFAGRALRSILHRHWPLFLTGSLATFASTNFATLLPTTYLLILLGILLCVYSLVSLMTPQIDLAKSENAKTASLVGVITGILTGLTGTFVTPAVPYFQALKLPRDELIQTMGVWFIIATLSLGLGLKSTGFLTNELGLTSVAAVIPALIGMWLGQSVRAKLPEKKFRFIFFVTLLVLGLYIAVRALLR